MRIERQFGNTLAAVVSAFLATLFLIACQQSQAPAPGSPPPEPKTTSFDVFVIFEGPWAIVPDPKDPNMVVAIAPKTKSHRSLAVVPVNKTLESGVYELSVPAHGAAGNLKLGPSFLQANVDPKNVQGVVDNKLVRYAVRLPKPEAYLAATQHRSRVGPAYPPGPSTEQKYVTSISLRYTVTSKAGFSLAGTKDAGGRFDPELLDLDTPVVRFEIDPDKDYDADPCNNHSREAFHHLVRLLGLTLYVDFPESPDYCHKKDPQVVNTERAQLLHDPQRDRGLFAGDLVDPQMAGISGGPLTPFWDSLDRKLARGWFSVMLFFHSDSGGCRAPIIVGGP